MIISPYRSIWHTRVSKIFELFYNLQARNLSVHEYVSMSLLRDAGVPTPKFGLATTAAEAKQIAEDLDTKDLVIKAQVRLTTYYLLTW